MVRTKGFEASLDFRLIRGGFGTLRSENRDLRNSTCVMSFVGVKTAFGDCNTNFTHELGRNLIFTIVPGKAIISSPFSEVFYLNLN